MPRKNKPKDCICTAGYKMSCPVHGVQQKNPLCDGEGPCDMGEVRIVPIGESNHHVCIRCHGRMGRDMRKRDRSARLSDPPFIWWDLKVYQPEPESIPGEHDVVIEAIEEASLGLDPGDRSSAFRND